MLRITALLLSLFFVNVCLATDDIPPYQQKKLPNGDIQTTYQSSDGAKVKAIQHKDGTSEATTLAMDGTKSIVILHKDGNVETQMINPTKTD